jgi:hypothetical protein
MPNKNKVVFFTTSTYSVNAFCFPQIVKLSQHNYRVYLICGSGDLEKPIYEYLEKVFSINSLNRKFSIINDCISFMIIINKQSKPDQTKNKKRNELLLLNDKNVTMLSSN